MKAIVKFDTGANKVGYLDIPEPVCGPHSVKIAIKAAAICITDLHIIDDEYPWPVGLPLGHEFCGIVVEAGSDVTRFKVGDRVVACMDGGFAKYVVKDEDDWVFHLPDSISFEEGALLEPLAAAVNSVQNSSSIHPGDTVLIEGPGVMGLFACQAAKLSGASVIVSGTANGAQRLALAEKLGADRTVNNASEDLDAAVHQMTGGKGVDTVIECSGTQAALDAGIRALRTGGQLTQVGIFGSRATVDLGHLVYHSKKIVGSIAYDRDTWLRTIRLAAEQKICLRCFVTDTLPLDDWKTGFELARKKQSLRIILIP